MRDVSCELRVAVGVDEKGICLRVALSGIDFDEMREEGRENPEKSKSYVLIKAHCKAIRST